MMPSRLPSVVFLGLLAMSGCASGEGVPKAYVVNQMTGLCMVEANFLGYGFDEPLGYGGQTRTREVVEGTAVGYAIIAQSSDCQSAAL